MPTRPKGIATGERRTDSRYEVGFRTVLIESDVLGEHVEIVNIARLGFLAHSDIHRETGSEIELNLPSVGRLSGNVVWSGNGLLGARFHEPIGERAFNEFLRNLPRLSGPDQANGAVPFEKVKR